MPGPSRRQVCAGTALVGVSWALSACVPEDGTSSPAGVLPEQPAGRRPPTLSGFRGVVGSTITVQSGEGGRGLLVSGVHDHGAATRKPVARGESFTVILDIAEAGPLIPSATYPATHPALGAFTLFLVSHLAPGKDRPRYSATFSRI